MIEADKPTVLIVDDEPHLVAALRRVLLRGRRWDVRCAHSGAEALELLEREPVAVILSDLRMPGMDGPELLRSVRSRHPRVARIVLSGASDPETSRRALDVAHRFLTKPTEATELLDVVSRACALRAAFDDVELTGALGALNHLPSPPAVLMEVTRLLSDPHSDLSHVGAALDGDPALAAKTLQVVNSAFFGLPQRQTNVSAAVAYLGATAIRSIITLNAFTDAAHGHVASRRLVEFEARSQRVARATSALLPPADHPDGHAAGLLHGLGWLALAVTRPEQSAAVDDGAPTGGDGGAPTPSRAAVGAFLLDLWGLPEQVVEAVSLHDGPCAADRSTLAHALQIAVAVEQQGAGTPPHPCLEPEHLVATGMAGTLRHGELAARA